MQEEKTKRTNIVKDAYVHVMNYVGLALVWFIVSGLGLFLTAGAATAAAYRVAFFWKDKDRHVPLFSTFFRGFKENLVSASLVHIPFLLFAIGLFFLHTYAQNTEETLLIIAVYLSAFELLLFGLYVFPLIAAFRHKNAFHLVRNTMILAHFHLFTTLKLIGTLAFSIFLVMVVHPALLPVSIALYFGFSSMHLEKILSIYRDKTLEALSDEE